MRPLRPPLGLLLVLTAVTASAAPPAPVQPITLPPANVRPPEIPARSAPFAKPVGAGISSVQQLDALTDRLHQRVWELYSMFGTLKDVRGRTAGEDVTQWLMTPQHEARLASLHADAVAESAKADQRGLSTTLGEAALVIEQEVYRGSMLETYWVLATLCARHIGNMQAIGERLSPPAPARDPAIEARASAVAQELQKALSAESPVEQLTEIEHLNKARLALLAALNETRGRYAEQLSQQQRTAGPEETTYPRDTPCPEPAARTSGASYPAFASLNAPPDSFYPDSSRRAEYEGFVTIKAWVSSSGCLLKAAVYSSSGVAELDEAALRWTQQVQFFPAERDRQPVDGTMIFKVKFVLRQ